MNVFALLSDDAAHSIGFALGPSHAVAATSDVAAVRKAMVSGKFTALVIDPLLLGDADLDELSPLFERSPVPVLLYTDLSSASARRVIRIAALGAHELILRGAEDDAALLAHKLERLVHHSAPAMLLSRLATALARFPAPLQSLSVGLYASGDVPRWVSAIPRQTGYARRTVDRWVSRAGLSGASALLDTARLAHVWEPLVERRLSPEEAGARCGYARDRMLKSHALRLVGVAPSEFATRLTRERFVDRLADAALANH